MFNISMKNVSIYLVAIFLAVACMKAARKGGTPGNPGKNGNGPTGNPTPTTNGKPPAGGGSNSGGSNYGNAAANILEGSWEEYGCTKDVNVEGGWNSYRAAYSVSGAQMTFFYYVYSAEDCTMAVNTSQPRKVDEVTYYITIRETSTNNYEVGYYDDNAELSFTENFSFSQNGNYGLMQNVVGFTSPDYEGTWYFTKK